MGLCYEMDRILNIYLAYLTVTNVITEMHKLDKPTDFALCLRYNDIFDIQRYKMDTGLKTDIDRDNLDTFGQFTVRDIFNYTPKVDDMLKGCALRYPGHLDLVFFNASECNRRLQIRKYTMQDYMCYDYSLLLNKTSSKSYEYSDVARSLSYMGTLAIFEVNVTSRRMKIMGHTYGSLPLMTWMFSPLVRYDIDDKKRNLQFNVESANIHIHRKPAPYDTNCLDYVPQERGQLTNQFECVKNKTLSYLDKMPIGTIIMDSSITRRVTSRKDLRNITVAAMLSNIKENCDAKYPQPNCDSLFTMNQVDRSSSIRDGIVVYLNIPRTLFIALFSHEVMTYLDFAIYTLSAAGSWLGISVFSFEPTKWLITLRRKLTQHTTALKLV
ncbi:hypothetical protein HDE_14067 [Halotydeus destructor]|nr:hypothetical protein HDE_14067 [Halotydeus destructor]